MGYVLQDLLQERVFLHFYQICRIPHGSGNEKALSDYICAWAKELGLEASQDEAHNVLIRKDAFPGYETAPTVMLQAHLDMVCEKCPGIDHDFKSDPIQWVIGEDTISTGGRTTLGADDGIGVALAMAVLEDDSLPHPPLEVLFTTMEEEDLSGAERFDAAGMCASLLINLDHVNEKEIICGSCGGMQTDLHIPVESGPVPPGWTPYLLSVSGLKGGHSGDDIHRGRGNANILLARLLMAVEEFCRLGPIKGGSFRLAIPREAEAVIWLDPARLRQVRDRLSHLEASFRAELPFTSDHVKVSLIPTDAPTWCVDPGSVLTALTLVPDGIHQMNEVFTGLVDTSDNLGEVYLDSRELRLVLEIRSARESLRTYLFQRMERLAALLGGKCHQSNAYPGWEFHPDSPLRILAGQVYEDFFGQAPSFLTVHAGLEVGHFFASKPGISAVAIGPDCWDFHSPSETVRISSVRRVYGYLCQLLSAIH